MSKINKIRIVFIACTAISFLLIYNVPASRQPTSQLSQLGQYGQVVLEINGVKYVSEIKSGTSVYDLMTKLKDAGQMNFKDKTYIGLGKFIEEINGMKGNGEKYWIYYVNGHKAEVGVSNYKINPGDVVSWKYE